MKISNKLLIMTLLIVIVSVVLTSFVFYLITRASTDQHIRMHLESVSVIKENQLIHYFEHHSNEIQYIDDVIIREYYDAYTNNLLSLESARSELLIEINQHMENSQFFEIFLMDIEGKVIFSTDPTQEKKIKKNSLYFQEGKQGKYIQKYYYSLTLGQPAITASRPVFNSQGELLGVIAGRVSLHDFSDIMTENAGLGETGETYLVNKFNYAVTELKKSENSALKQIVNTVAVDNCLKNKNTDIEFGIYMDYTNEKVVGAYSWLPDSEICLVVEIDEAEAHKVLNQRIQLMAIVFILLLLFSSSIVVFFSREIIRPLSKLKVGAQKIAQGDLNYTLKINSKDEIKDVADSFNYMVKQLKKTKKEQEEYSYTLEYSVEQRTKELNKKLEELENTKLAVMNILDDTDESNKELLKLRDQLNKNIKELKDVDRTKDEFLSITAHELKTPLTSIRGFIELLKMPKIMKNKEQRDKYFDIIVDDTHRLGQLITDILDLSRLDVGTMKFSFEKTTAQDLIQELKNLIDLAIINKGLKSIYEIDKNVPDLFIDKSRILQVISNLVNNAIKYTEKGHIKVGIYKEKDKVYVYVEDTGTGIPKEEHNKIFKRFYQVDSSYTRKVGGSGLGLAISQGIVEQHGGKIWVEKSVIGKGTTFMFTIGKKHLK